MQYGMLVPFLDPSPTYCYGVEYGMNVIAKMLRTDREFGGYFRTENEEQIRLTCYRLGWEVAELKPWRFEGKCTGWVWMVVRPRPTLIDGAGI